MAWERSSPRRHGGHGPLLHHVFFALKPTPRVAAGVWRWAESRRTDGGLRGRPTPPERLHLTMNAVGVFHDLDGPFETQMITSAQRAASRVVMPSFVVELTRVVSWRGSPRPLVLIGEDGLIGVDLLHQEISGAMADLGLPSHGIERFNPHVTLLRDRIEQPPQWIRPVRWRVREFLLIHSPFGLSRHNVLGRWPLLG